MRGDEKKLSLPKWIRYKGWDEISEVDQLAVFPPTYFKREICLGAKQKRRKSLWLLVLSQMIQNSIKKTTVHSHFAQNPPVGAALSIFPTIFWGNM